MQDYLYVGHNADGTNKGPAGGAIGVAYPYNLNTALTGTPNSGEVRFDNTATYLATHIRIHGTNSAGVSVMYEIQRRYLPGSIISVRNTNRAFSNYRILSVAPSPLTYVDLTVGYMGDADDGGCGTGAVTLEVLPGGRDTSACRTVACPRRAGSTSTTCATVSLTSRRSTPRSPRWETPPLTAGR
jgi:hypothetical protein